MKLKIKLPNSLLILPVCLVICLFLLQTSTLYAQDSTGVAKEPTTTVKAKPVKNTFNGTWIIDDQTVIVPVKGTFQMDIMHRFGIVGNGYQDLDGLFAPANIRFGLNYAPINNLYIGIGLTKADMLWDGNAKYAIIKQTNGGTPVSITYFGDLAYNTQFDGDHSLFPHTSDRITSYNEIIIASKLTERFSIQVAPTLSHQNSVNGYYTKIDSTGSKVFEEMKHDQFGIAIAARYKISDVTSIIVDYDQPITQQPTNNPHPNLAFGFEFTTSGHTFQIFMGNYQLLNQSHNNLFNTNNPFSYTDANGTKVKGGQFCFGFNISRLWNF
ncbi:DUF5777 family beta-barrel protein [Mucilaginibacter sp.]